MGLLGGILDHNCGVRFVVCPASTISPAIERPQGRCAGLPSSTASGFPVASLAPLQRTSAGRSPSKKTGSEKKRRQFFLESISYVQSENAQVSPLRAFATPGDSAMLESCPFRLPANRGGSG